MLLVKSAEVSGSSRYTVLQAPIPFPEFSASKVENILKGSLDLIPSPSPSMKIQIMGTKVCLKC